VHDETQPYHPQRGTEIMKKNAALQLLTEQFAEINQRFGVRRLALFGSTARDEAQPGSDVDVLVEFEGKADSSRYFGLLFYLEDRLGCPLDLVTSKALRPELRPFVEKDAIYVP
jgi:hypothetical protein